MRSAEFLAGLLDPSAPAFVTAEDLDGPHEEAIRAWQDRGFIGTEPGRHPVPSCPHCAEGVPYRTGGRLLCSACHSVVAPRELLAWPVHREAVFGSLAACLGLRDGIRPVGDLWELGSGTADGGTVACFYHPGGHLREPERQRLTAYRRTVVLHGPLPADPAAPGRWVALAGLLGPDGSPAPLPLADLLRASGRVTFDPETGALRVGGMLEGEVPVGGREWALLACLAEQLDQFVAYRELKRGILARTGGTGGADEATFCQKLKSRIKERYVPVVDRLVVTNNKGDGYRLRAEGSS